MVSLSFEGSLCTNKSFHSDFRMRRSVAEGCEPSLPPSLGPQIVGGSTLRFHAPILNFCENRELVVPDASNALAAASEISDASQERVLLGAGVVPPYVNMLAPELLSDIFLTVGFGECWLVRVAVSLSSVCQYWRDVLHGASVFWTDVRVGNVELAKACLTRSKNAITEFLVSPQYHCKRDCVHSLPPSQEILDLLAKSLPRVGSLRLSLHSASFSCVFSSLDGIEAPLLEYVEMQNMDGKADFMSRIIPTLTVDSAIATSNALRSAPLRHLELHLLILNAPVTFYPSLRSLIVSLGRMQSCDPKIILRTLRASAELEEVTLQFLCPVEVASAVEPTVSLLRLRKLTVRVPQPHDAFYLLERLDLPNIAQVVLDITSPGATAAFRLVPRVFSLLKLLPSKFLQGTSHVKVTQFQCTDVIGIFGLPDCECWWDKATLLVQFPSKICDVAFVEFVLCELYSILPSLSGGYFADTTWTITTVDDV